MDLASWNDGAAKQGIVAFVQAVTEGRRLMLLVRHGHAEREYACDEAAAKGWIVVSMKSDWKRVFPFEAAK